MADDTRCASMDCPLASTCRRHEASGAERAPGWRSDVWHWRRDSFDDRVVCNGFEPVPTPVMEEVDLG